MNGWSQRLARMVILCEDTVFRSQRRVPRGRTAWCPFGALPDALREAPRRHLRHPAPELRWGRPPVQKAIDDQFGLMARLAACLPERRQAGKVEHDLPTLIHQRSFALSCGYADANDAAHLKADPIQRLLAGRDPVAGPVLASQPALSRIENALSARDVYWLTQTLADVVIGHHQIRQAGIRVRRITIDCDSTDDPTHGKQEPN